MQTLIHTRTPNSEFECSRLYVYSFLYIYTYNTLCSTLCHALTSEYYFQKFPKTKYIFQLLFVVFNMWGHGTLWHIVIPRNITLNIHIVYLSILHKSDSVRRNVQVYFLFLYRFGGPDSHKKTQFDCNFHFEELTV